MRKATWGGQTIQITRNLLAWTSDIIAQAASTSAMAGGVSRWESAFLLGELTRSTQWTVDVGALEIEGLDDATVSSHWIPLIFKQGLNMLEAEMTQAVVPKW